MINLFVPTHSTKLSDNKNCLYVLLDKKQKKPKPILKKLGNYLLDSYNLVFKRTNLKTFC